jgi:hypothetical protein
MVERGAPVIIVIAGVKSQLSQLALTAGVPMLGLAARVATAEANAMN